MLKAFYDVAGSENVERISVEYSIGPGLFIRAKAALSSDQSLLDQVGERWLLVNQAIPIQKHSISTDDAVDLFQKNRMYYKSRLFSDQFPCQYLFSRRLFRLFLWIHGPGHQLSQMV